MNPVELLLNFDLIFFSIWLIFTPSNKTFPVSILYNTDGIFDNVLFPDPGWSTSAILCPDSIVKFKFSITGAESLE